MMPQTAAATPRTDDRSSGGRLVAADGQLLPLRESRLSVEAEGGLARVILTQTFENPHALPLAVTYQLPLPERGAVSGFSFTVGELEIQGEVDRRAAARERFEEALALGQTAALLEQDRSSLFTQEVGNIPARETVVARIVIDQRLDWLSEGAWSWRFPTVVAPRYLGEAGRVPDAARLDVDVSPAGTSPRIGFALRIRDRLSGGEPTSPTHQVHLQNDGAERVVGLAEEAGATLDRDLVVTWPVAGAGPETLLTVSRPPREHPRSREAFGLLSLVPPEASHPHPSVARDLIVLLDTSGSMHGAPLEQAKHLVAELIATLGAQDQLELIEFSNAARRFEKKPVSATHRNRQRALKWISGLSAGGATEMKQGIFAALESLRSEAQRQVVLITDGLIGSEQEIVSTVERRLPSGSRVHCIGVGSGVNRSLTGPVSRAGRGLELVLDLDDDPAPAAKRLIKATDAPLVVDLRVEGSALFSCAPSRAPDLFAGQPALLGLRLSPDGGTLRLTGRTAEGLFERTLTVPATACGEGSGALPILVAREEIEDLELQLAGGRPATQVDPEIEARGLEFQVATRLTSWVAISREATVDPRDPTRHQRLPQALPHGMSIERLGLRSASGPTVVLSQAGIGSIASHSDLAAAPVDRRSSPGPRKSRKLSLDGIFGGEKRKQKEEAPKAFDEELEDRSGGLPGEGPGDLPDLADLDAAPAPGQLSRADFLAPRVLEARLLRRKGRSLTFELELPTRLLWAPALEMELEDADGRTFRATVDPRSTTRDGELAAGTRVRLTLLIEVDEDRPGEARVLRLLCEGAPLELRVRVA